MNQQQKMIAAGVGLLVLGAVLYFSSTKKPTKKKPKAVKNKRDTPKAPIKKPTEHKNTTKNVVQKPKTVAKKPAAAKKHAAVVVAKKPAAVVVAKKPAAVVVAKKPAAAAPVVAKKPAAIAPKPAVVKKEEPKKVAPKPASEPANPKPAATKVPEKAPVPEKATTPKPKPAPKKQAETKVIAAPKVEEAVKPVAKEPEAPQPKPAAVASELATPKRVEPKTGTLKIMNIRGKTLVNKDNVGQGDPYFIIKLGKQTFKTQRQSGANPTFTERFNLNVREPYATVHLSGMEWDRFTTHDLIGSSSPNVDIFRQSKSQTTHSFDLYKKGKKGSQGTMVFDCVWEPDQN